MMTPTIAQQATRTGTSARRRLISVRFACFAMNSGPTLMIISAIVMITTTRVEIALILGFTRLLMV